MVTKSQVKYIQSLSQKKFRQAEGLFIVEGPKMVNELIAENRLVINDIYYTKDWPIPAGIRGNVALHSIEESDLKKMSQLNTPNQVLALVKQPGHYVGEINGLWLLLDTIQDPGNVGTILRLADWFGVKGVALTEGCADPFSSKVVQSTMGSLSRVPMLEVNGASFLQKNAHLPRYAAVLGGDNLYSFGSLTEGILVIGNESKGIHPDIAALCSHAITIPKQGGAESLNAAVATGILLSWLTRP